MSVANRVLRFEIEVSDFADPEVEGDERTLVTASVTNAVDVEKILDAYGPLDEALSERGLAHPALPLIFLLDPKW